MHLIVRTSIYRVNIKVNLATQSTTINAPRSQVFQRFASFKKDTPPSAAGEGATILERLAGRELVEFVSRDDRSLYRTPEEVRLYPEERITFRHLEGPLKHASEELRRSEVSGGTHITYKGQIERRTPFLPGGGWRLAFLYVRPEYGNVVKRHMEMLKQAAEAPGAGDMMNEDE